VQGGYPAREMGPMNGNITSVSLHGQTVGGFVMSIELTRRDFLKAIFSTASAAAVSGALPLWPTEARARPTFNPIQLSIEDGYLVDSNFDYCEVCLPTHRELHSLLGLKGDALKVELESIFYEFEWVVADPDNWTVDELEEWLDTQVELDQLGAWEAMRYTQYGPAIELYERMSWANANELGLQLIEGEFPGSSFVGIAFHGDIAELNRDLQKLGMNLVVSE
jgi:hypothetical protein